jgi:plastocyanin
MSRMGLIAVLCGALVGVPALATARDDPPAQEHVETVDGMTPTFSPDSVTIVTGGKVTFHSDSATTYHAVTFQGDDKPTCPGVAQFGEFKHEWTGYCEFTKPGTYSFVCQYHEASMHGTVVVRDPAPTAPATPTVSGTSTPGPGATPTPEPGVTPTPQTTLRGAVKLAGAQRGSRVRGSVTVKAAKSRLEVALFVPRSKLSGGTSRRAVRVGRWVQASTAEGSVRFSVPLSAQARGALRRAKRLAVTVSVALTPPGGHKLTRSLHATLRR